jgi:hypothetical protein
MSYNLELGNISRNEECWVQSQKCGFNGLWTAARILATEQMNMLLLLRHTRLKGSNGTFCNATDSA